MNKSESKYFNTAKKMDIALMELLGKKPLEYITVSEIFLLQTRSFPYFLYKDLCWLPSQGCRKREYA